MRQFPKAGVAAACMVLLTGATGAFGQGRINTNIDTAEKISRATGRPILAIAGKMT